ncbi:RagB/SusD family nutrient uptake outer membrane protein [Compostibacter hankyongensis]|uniref:RagB/SusD family nutrient uptake outer membrane protein n=1 Tax=Compostibacter hankyongensis TaxID=1007089 RepID=A0ABP8FMR0_9BACT
MKTSKYIVIALLTGILTVGQSCSLKEELKDVPTPASIKTEQDLTAVEEGIYARLNNRNGFKFLGMLILFLNADDIYSTSGSEFGPYADRSYTGNNTAEFFNMMYYVISDANSLIALLDRSGLDPTVKSRGYGEAYFLRAFAYYYLVRLFGGVPLRTGATSISSDFYLPRSSADSVYRQIFTDFKNASALLPPAAGIPGGELGRASKGAAQALLAEACLTYGDHLSLQGKDGTAYFQNAALYADSVLNSGQYHLLPDFADVFDVKQEAAAYKEVIFGVRFQTDPTQSGQPAAGSEFALRCNAPNQWNTSGNNPNGQGDGSFRAMPWFADYYRTGDYGDTDIVTGEATFDYRNQVSLSMGGYKNGQFCVTYPNIPAPDESTIALALCGKYVDPNGKDGRNNGNDFYIIRLSEVYLIKAEAENELHGPTQEALDAFNAVRARIRKADGTSRALPADITLDEGLTKEQFRMKIFDERGIELFGEGQRWFDLVRMRSPVSATQTMYEYQFLHVLPAYTTELPKYKAATHSWSTHFAVFKPALNVSVPKFLLFPIPTNELQKNPDFGEQNPGW